MFKRLNEKLDMVTLTYQSVTYFYTFDEIVLIYTYPLGSEKLRDIPVAKVAFFYLEYGIELTDDHMLQIKECTPNEFALIAEWF